MGATVFNLQNTTVESTRKEVAEDDRQKSGLYLEKRAQRRRKEREPRWPVELSMACRFAYHARALGLDPRQHREDTGEKYRMQTQVITPRLLSGLV